MPKIMQKQEHEAIARLKKGDINGLETLVQLYQVPALDAAYLITRNHALAEDIVQDTFLHAYRRIHKFDQTRPFGPWFLRSVVNGALTAVTNPRNKHLSLDAQAGAQGSGSHDEKGEGGSGSGYGYGQGQDYSIIEILSLEPGLQEVLERAETREEILATLDTLPPEQRAAIVMRYYLDWSDAEVSQRTGIPAGTVRWRLHEAKRRLHRLLSGYVRQL